MYKKAETEKKRLLIFVIAYYADATLRSVLERIPRSLFDQFSCEVLVVDDASNDRTFEIGHEYKAHHPGTRMTVLRNEYTQGYGGNQKVGYSFAIREEFDFVAMIHGDGQYAPEELPRLMEPLARGQADAVFGSRMMERFAALKGGMPLYKFLGNKILTAIQNRLLGAALSEFHSGYRIYSVAALKVLPFRLNSNDFHFDTEIIIQLLNANLRIVELPIPTYYGDEISRVNGIHYAFHVIWATLKNNAHHAGIFYQRRFDTSPRDNSHYTLKLGYPSSHSFALDAIPSGASVLDIGAGPRGLAKELVRKHCRVAVVDQHSPEEVAGVRVFLQDLDAPLEFDVKPHQYLLLLDVIEHLKDPELFLDQLRAQFEYEPKTLILTTPNIAFIAPRLVLFLTGQFNYGKAGILDRTHMRLFTFRSIKHLLADSGFRIDRVRGVPAPFPKIFGSGALGRSLVGANMALIRVSKTLFFYQIYVEARSTPGVEFLLQDAVDKSEHRRSRLGLSATAGRAQPPVRC